MVLSSIGLCHVSGGIVPKAVGKDENKQYRLEHAKDALLKKFKAGPYYEERTDEEKGNQRDGPRQSKKRKRESSGEGLAEGANQELRKALREYGGTSVSNFALLHNSSHLNLVIQDLDAGAFHSTGLLLKYCDNPEVLAIVNSGCSFFFLINEDTSLLMQPTFCLPFFLVQDGGIFSTQSSFASTSSMNFDKSQSCDAADEKH